MENLKNIIAYGKHDQVRWKNLEKNLEYTQGYVENNASHMDEFSLRKTLEKQAHRKEQLEFLD